MALVNCISIVATPDQQPSTLLFAWDEQRLSLGDLLVVTNDNIRPPIITQNGRNKQTFDTYACTIDLVPLVLEKTCFAGHIFEYKLKINKTKQKAQSRKCNVEMRKRKYMKKSHLQDKPGSSTNVGGA